MNPLLLTTLIRWLMWLAVGVAVVTGYYFWADHIGYKREAEVRAEYQAQADDADAKRAAIAAPIVQKEAAAQAVIRTVTKTIIKEVPTYVQATACPLPGGFRVLHDAAANGEVPDPARVADAAAVPARDAAVTVAENYGTCRENATRLSGLQEWVRAQATLK